MKKELPLQTPPLTKAYQFDAFDMAVMMADEAKRGWIYSNLIQIQCRVFNEETRNPCLMFYNVNILDREREPLEKHFLREMKFSNKEDTVDIIKIMINNDYYVCLLCDIFHIKKIRQFESHHVHDFLIYGYDDDREVFNVYAITEINLERFEAGFDEVIEAYASDYKAEYYYMYFLKNKEGEFKMEYPRFEYLLADYRDGIDTQSRENINSGREPTNLWGSRVYDELLRFYRYMSLRNEPIQVNQSYAFYEHKKLMYERFKYINEGNTQYSCPDGLLKEFSDVYELAGIYINLILKINQKIRLKLNAEKEFTELIEIVEKIRSKELKAIDDFFEINNYRHGG